MKRLIVKSDLFDNLKQLETKDYQNRGNNYPESDIPDTIRVYKDSKNKININFIFKNTDESDAKQFVNKFINEKGYVIDYINSSQTGEYQDDWVTVTVQVKD